MKGQNKMSVAYWLHILIQLVWGYQHIRCPHALYAYYVHHHAIGFLRSGITSETPNSVHSAVRLLRRFLIPDHMSPVDW